MTERGPSLMMIPGEYQPRWRAPALAPGEPLEVSHARPDAPRSAGGAARAVAPQEWPVWVRLVVPLAVLFLAMFVGLWATSITR